MTMERYECQDVQAVLSGLLDGELDAPAAHLAEAHLARCGPCRDLLQQAEETDDVLRVAMARHEVWPASLERRIRAEVFGVVGEADANHRRRRLLIAAWSGWSMAAVVMLGFGFSISQGWLTARPAESSPPLAFADTGPEIAPGDPDVWLSPVGSEDLARSIFDDLLLTEAGAAAHEEGESPAPAVQGPALAMENEPSDTRVSQPIAPARPAFSNLALAGMEAEISAARQAEMWASARAAREQQPVLAPVEEPGPAVESSAQFAAAEAESGDPTMGEVLHQASILLTALAQAGDESFGDVRKVQQALSSDDVLERLAMARGDLDSPDSVDLVNRAWTLLEWTTGSVDQEELERVKHSIAMQDLPRRLEQLSDLYWN